MKTVKPYPNEALTEVAKMLLDDYELTIEQIRNLACDLEGEAEAINEGRWERQQADLQEDHYDTRYQQYRDDLIDAGRGHLVNR